MSWQKIGNLRGVPGEVGLQGVPGPAGIGEIGPVGPKGETGAPGQTVTIVGSFTRPVADLPPDGNIPVDWEAPGSPPTPFQMVNGQGMFHIPTDDVCLWVGTALHPPSGWIIIGNVTGPQGPAGEMGQPGSQGEEGVQGIQGEPGPPGPIGPIGIGIKGDKGDAGIQGVQGPVGLTGAPGAQGPIGPPGPNSVSADAGNIAKLGTDSLILVPDSAPRRGVTDGSSAAAGMVGEYIQANNTAGSALTTGVALNVATLNLTAGDWDVWGQTIFTEGANTIPTVLASATGPTSATLPTPAQLAAGTGAMSQIAATMTKGLTQIMQTGPDRYSSNAPQTVYLVAQGTFSGGTLTVTGFVSARRIR